MSRKFRDKENFSFMHYEKNPLRRGANFCPANPHFTSCTFACTNILGEASTLFLANQPLETFRGNSLLTTPFPGDKSRFRKCPDVHQFCARPSQRRGMSEMWELTYVKMRWITSPRTSCWVLRRGISASSQIVLKRHCLPSCQPCLKGQH